MDPRQELELYRKLESGNISQREELNIYRQLEGTSTDSLDNFSEGTRVGIANTLGGPVDLVNAGLSQVGLGSDMPFGGSESIKSGFGKIGIPTDQAEGMAGQVGEVVGAGASALLGLGPFMSGGGQALTGAARTSGPLKRVGEDIAATAIKNPGKFLAAETGASALAGVAGYEAAKRFPDTPGARALGEIIGGVSFPLALNVAKVGTGISPMMWAAKGTKETVDSLTVSGGRRRAKDRLRRAVDNPDFVSERSDVLPESGLTFAQRSGERGLLALERSVMESTERLKGDRAEQFREVNETIRNAFQVGDSADAQTYIQQLLDTRLRIAAEIADQRLEAVGPRATREDINRLARIEIENALSSARAQESQLYDVLDMDATVNRNGVTARFQHFENDLGLANKTDMPPVARRLLGESDDALPSDTNLREMRALQSKLRQEARNARAMGQRQNLNRARIADDMADAITDDISGVAGEDVARAVSYSRALNERFKQGEVGKLLGRDYTGAPSTPAGMTLEVLGGGGPRSREISDALMDAARWAQNTSQGVRNRPDLSPPDSRALQTYIGEYLSDAFRREAVRDGVVDTKKASVFMRKHNELLRRHPEVAERFLAAKASRQTAETIEGRTDPRISRTGIYLKAPPGKEIDRVLSSSEPGETMSDLVALARTDKSGQALAGLKQSFMERLLKRSEISATDAADQSFISGQKLGRELDNRSVQEAMNSLLTEGERQRMAQIRQTASVLDSARSTPASDEGIIGDAPGRLTSTLARVIGAQVGRQVAQGTGGGTVQTPGIFASRAEEFLRLGVSDPARRLLTDAVQDEGLFRTLLIEIQTPQQADIVQSRLNGWAASVLNEDNQ